MRTPGPSPSRPSRRSFRLTHGHLARIRAEAGARGTVVAQGRPGVGRRLEVAFADSSDEIDDSGHAAIDLLAVERLDDRLGGRLQEAVGAYDLGGAGRGRDRRGVENA